MAQACEPAPRPSFFRARQAHHPELCCFVIHGGLARGQGGLQLKKLGIPVSR
jgi:hypothetical protein